MLVVNFLIYCNYLFDIKKIKLEYENRLKKRKYEYDKKYTEINNKFKIFDNQNNLFYDYRIRKLEKELNYKSNYYKQNIQEIKDLVNIKKLSEIVLNTYNIYSSNYFNSINITNILKEWEDNEPLSKISAMKTQKCNDIHINPKDYITIIYKINKNDKEVQIFGDNFVKNNNDKCTIIYKNKEYELMSKFDITNINNNLLEIILKGFSNVTNMSYMFSKCNCLLYIPNISKWDTTNIEDMSYLFYDCSTIEYLPDISVWNVKNVKNMTEMFSGCSSLLSLPDISKWELNYYLKKDLMFFKCKESLVIHKFKFWNEPKIRKRKRLKD